MSSAIRTPGSRRADGSDTARQPVGRFPITRNAARCGPGATGPRKETSVVTKPVTNELLPHVLILGGGFGGVNAARELADKAVRVTLIRRRNHHLFQPLLYQVATAALNPSDIAVPIRRILRKQRNVEVLLAEAVSIDLSNR